MSKVIKDFSKKVEMVNPENDFHYTDYVDLKVMDWGEPQLVAYTFNCGSKNTAKQLMEALNEFKVLIFVTGVSKTNNAFIQAKMREHMESMFGDKVGWRETGKESTQFYLKK